MKRVAFTVALAALGLSALLTCGAAAPTKIADVAPVADLVTEAEGKIKALEAALATEQEYLQAKNTSIPAHAGVLAVLTQAISESEEKGTWKASAPDLRDAAIAVANSKTFDEAKKGLAAIKEAEGGKASGAKPEADWNKLSKLLSLMKEVQARNTKIKRGIRDMKNPEESSRHASVLAVLALAVHDDTHEVKNPAEVPDWQKFSKEFSAQMTATAAAFKKSDKAAADGASKKANMACNACHDKFRPDLAN